MNGIIENLSLCLRKLRFLRTGHGKHGAIFGSYCASLFVLCDRPIESLFAQAMNVWPKLLGSGDNGVIVDAGYLRGRKVRVFSEVENNIIERSAENGSGATPSNKALNCEGAKNCDERCDYSKRPNRKIGDYIQAFLLGFVWAAIRL